MQFNRKMLLLILLAGFAGSNIIAGLSQDYSVIMILRMCGGIFAGVMWPMIAAYGMRLVDKDQHGKAIAVIMAGNTLGISIGIAIYAWRETYQYLLTVCTFKNTLSGDCSVAYPAGSMCPLQYICICYPRGRGYSACGGNRKCFIYFRGRVFDFRYGGY